MEILGRDGYRISYEILGAGPRIVWVDPALASSAMRPLQEAIDVLREHFEVVTYDRRGRGRNEPVAEVSKQQEIEDLHALVSHVGRAASVVGFSSGGALVLHAAPALDVDRIVLLEPAFDLVPDSSGLAAEVASALDAGHPEEAVLSFYEAIGAPDEIVSGLPGSDAWPHLVRSATTLLSDLDLAYVEDATLSRITLPVDLVISDGSPDEITSMSRVLAERIDARVWEDPGGWHGVDADALSHRLLALLAA
jgi:hypothetical protein